MRHPDHPDAAGALACPRAMMALLWAWAEHGWIRDLDAALAHQLARLAPTDHAECLLAAALVSHQAGQGHLLLDLARAHGRPTELIAVPPTPNAEAADSAPPAPETLLARLPSEGWAGALAGWAAVATGPGSTPLVLDGTRLYLRRYWRHERQVARAIDARLTPPKPLDPAALRPVLDALFPPPPPGAPHPAAWQKRACALGARSPFSVITGGPGTGKTTTVIRLLALIQVQAMMERGAPLAVHLAAPTGKAAARLSESISGQIKALEQLDIPQAARVSESIPDRVTTLHRLLGARPNTRRFRYHRLNPLPLDLVAVDEASMIDIDMMAALLDALAPHARLVLLGDKDQLASVEAGAVLGSLCARAEDGRYLPATAEWLEKATGDALPARLQAPDGRALDQAIAMLRHSFRFDSQSGIGQLAGAINRGRAADALGILDAPDYPDVTHRPLPPSRETPLIELALNGREAGPSAEPALGYRHYLSQLHTRPEAHAPKTEWDAWATGILQAHTRFQLLTPLRQSRHGVEALNQRIEQALAREGLITLPDATARWYEGRPILVTGNDYALNLMNGDIGIALEVPVTFGDAEAGTTLRVAFPGSEQGDIRWVLPSRLQQIETVYAMTVHKSQGSEFTHTALVMPDALSPVLTRELVYTAVTRAKQAFTLLSASDDVLTQAINRRIARQSQLFEPV